MAKRKSLHKELTTALRILEQRKIMIPRYYDQSIKWVGKNHYTMDLIPDLEKQIDETKAAIRGIEQWRKERKMAKNIDNVEK